MALIALAGCGNDTVAEPNGTGLLFAYEAGNHLHHYGGRVFGDGRYELFSTSDETPDWTAFEPFTPQQVDQIGQAVDAALASNLPHEIKGSRPPDAVRAIFTLRGHKIVVDEYPKAAPAELEAILDRIAELRRKPPVPSTWKVWSDGKVVELQVPCEMGEVEVLSRLRDAVFMPDASADTAPGDDPPEGTPLVAIEFANGERLAVSADDADTGRVAAVRAALAATDWSALPSRLC